MEVSQAPPMEPQKAVVAAAKASQPPRRSKGRKRRMVRVARMLPYMATLCLAGLAVVAFKAAVHGSPASAPCPSPSPTLRVAAGAGEDSSAFRRRLTVEQAKGTKAKAAFGHESAGSAAKNKAAYEKRMELDEDTMETRLLSFCKTLGWCFVLFYLFFAVAILCDKYVVPSIELICEGLNIPDEMACASFLAFGEAAPEIMISALATYKGKFSMGMGGILGSAIIAFGLIPAGSAVVAPDGLHLLLGPIVRDTSAFLIALTVLVLSTADELVDKREAGIMLVLFVAYLLLIFAPKIHQMCKKSEEYDPISQQEGDDDDDDDDKEGGEDEEEMGSSGCLKIIFYVCQPIYWVFRITMFDLEDDSNCRHLYPFTFLLSMGYIALLSHGIIEATEEIASDLGMTTVLASVTFIAMGAQVPDTMSALMLARAGHDDGAISHAISSQVMNIVLGVGGPTMVYNLAIGPMQMNLGGLHVAAGCVFALVFLYLLNLVVARIVHGEIWLGRTGGGILFVAYIACTIFIAVNECCLKWG